MSFVYKCNCTDKSGVVQRWIETVVDKDGNCVCCGYAAVAVPKYDIPRGKSIGQYQPMALEECLMGVHNYSAQRARDLHEEGLPWYMETNTLIL